MQGRIIDLSQAAAREIDMVRAGTARVRLKVIRPPDNLPVASRREQVPITAPPSPAVESATPRTEIITETLPPVPTPPVVTSTGEPQSPGTPASTPATFSLSPPRASGYAVQAGAFADAARAESLRAMLLNDFSEARVASNGRTPPIWRVIVGRAMTRDQATDLAIRVRRVTGAAVVVLESESEPPPDK